MSNFHLVVVTFNRCQLLTKCLDSLIAQSARQIEKIWVIDNASTDNTEFVMKSYIASFPLLITYLRQGENLGGSGGFALGLKMAFEAGAQWVGLLDDDVLFAPDCLQQISRFTNKYKCLIGVRESKSGELAEYAALKYDLRNPFRINPKTATIASVYKSRAAMPEVCPIDGASFEGFFIERSVIEKVGFPFAEYFIFGDDFDYTIRVRQAGFQAIAVRDAIITRQLDYKRVGLDSWKTFFVWRNFFVLHFLYGENVWVRSKPYVLSVCLWFWSRINQKPVDSKVILYSAKELSKKMRKLISNLN